MNLKDNWVSKVLQTTSSLSVSYPLYKDIHHSDEKNHVIYFEVNDFQLLNPPPSFKGGVWSDRMALWVKALVVSLTTWVQSLKSRIKGETRLPKVAFQPPHGCQPWHGHSTHKQFAGVGSFPVPCLLEIKLGSPGLVTSIFTHGTISLALKMHISYSKIILGTKVGRGYICERHLEF